MSTNFIAAKISWQEFNKEMLQNQDVEKVIILNKEAVQILHQRGSIKKRKTQIS